MHKSIILVFVFFSFAAKSQVSSDTLGKKLHFYSSLGVGTIDKSFQPAHRSSIQTSTGAEYRFSNHSYAVLMVSFDSYGYRKSATSYNVDGSLKSTALALLYRYRFGAGRFRPYLMAGGGVNWLSVPTVTVSQGTTSFKQQTQLVGVANAEAGVLFRFLSRHYWLLGVEREQLARSSFLDNASIGTTTFKVGLVSSF